MGAVSSKLAEKWAKSAGQRAFAGAPITILKERRRASHSDPKIITRAPVQGNL
jgi:hypothetical protein